MKLKDISKEDLETMSYSEITKIILNEKGSKMKIVDIFKKICDELELSNTEYENKIVDFFELISTDKNFIVLDKGFCDLKTRHNQKVVVEDDEENDDSEQTEEENIDVEEENTENEDEDIFYDEEEPDDDLDSDELDDLVVMDEEEEASI